MATLIHGIGLNDMKGMEKTKYYRKWVDMLNRCYCQTFQSKKPEYKGCEVCREWHKLSVFYEWMAKQDWDGKELDKDIIVKNNKLYSPETCCFVDRSLNTIFQRKPKRKHHLPRGVWSNNKKFSSVLTVGKRKHLGTFDTPFEAHAAWVFSITEYIESLLPTLDDRICAAIRQRICYARLEIANGRLVNNL